MTDREGEGEKRRERKRECVLKKKKNFLTSAGNVEVASSSFGLVSLKTISLLLRLSIKVFFSRVQQCARFFLSDWFVFPSQHLSGLAEHEILFYLLDLGTHCSLDWGEGWTGHRWISTGSLTCFISQKHWLKHTLRNQWLRTWMWCFKQQISIRH